MSLSLNCFVHMLRASSHVDARSFPLESFQRSPSQRCILDHLSHAIVHALYGIYLCILQTELNFDDFFLLSCRRYIDTYV